MFKFFIAILLLFSTSYADEKESATKIVKAIVGAISVSSDSVWVEKNDKEIYDFIDIKSFVVSENCNEAGVLLVKHPLKLDLSCNTVPMLVLDYKLLQKYENAVAAFYWKKGRPNIVFIKDRVQKFDIKLPPSYEIYQEETLW